MSSRDSQQIEEQLAAYAIGALDGNEVAQVEAALNRSAENRAELKALRDVVSLLPYAAQPVEPPARVRRQLFARIEASQVEQQPVSPPRAIPVAQGWRGTRFLMPVALAVMLVLVLGLGTLTLGLQSTVNSLAQTNQELTAKLDQMKQTVADTKATQQALVGQSDESRQKIGALTAQLDASQRDVDVLKARIYSDQRDLAALRQQIAQEQQVFNFVTAPGVATRILEAKNTNVQARGEMYMYPGHSEAVVLFRGLPPLQQGQVYRFWLANNEGQIPAAEPVVVSADGVARLVVKAPREVNAYTQVMLTIELESGSNGPSNNVVLEGLL